MSTYKYTALNKAGKVITGEIESAEQNYVHRILTARELVPLDIQKKNKRNVSQSFWKRSRKISDSDREIFAKQIALFSNSAVQSRTLFKLVGESQEHPKLTEISNSIHEKILSGQTISNATSAHQKTLNSDFINFIKAGEKSNSLAKVMDIAAQYYNFKAKNQNKVITVLIYPAVLACTTIMLLALIVFKFVPEISGLILLNGLELSPILKIMMYINDFFVRFVWVILILVLLFSLLIVMKTHQNKKSKSEVNRHLLIKLPIIGKLLLRRQFSIAILTLLTNLRIGMQLSEALKAVYLQNASFDPEIISFFSQMDSAIMNGQKIAKTTTPPDFVPNSFSTLLGIAEENNNWENVLALFHNSLNDSIERTTNRAISLLPVAITLFMGVIIGTIVFLMINSMLSLNDIQIQ